MKIKICGLKTLEDIEIVNRCRPDYIGFVFAGNKRKITPAQATAMKERLLPEIVSVGVFINEPPENIAALVRAGVLDMVQLHGEEDEAYIRRLKELVDCPLIKAVRVRTTEEIQEAETLPCEYLLLDSYQTEEYGGSGKVFSWEKIPKLSKPYFLAGGLNEKNIPEALRQCSPWAVDVSSAAETDGRKDAEKVRRLVAAARAC